MSPVLPAGRNDRLESLLGALEATVAELRPEELPVLFGALERAKRAAELRLVLPAPAPASEVPQALLTAKQVAELLVVSVTEVYRLAKGQLRSAAIDVGEGTLRFDSRRVERFLDARRRA